MAHIISLKSEIAFHLSKLAAKVRPSPPVLGRARQRVKWYCPKGTDPRRAADEFATAAGSGNVGAASCRTMGRQDASPTVAPISPAEPREVRELKQIVNGLREEMAAYLANGNGTPRSYWRRLIQRTQQEAQIYERTRRELEHETNPTVFEQKNQALRNLGLRTIPNPKDGE